MQARRHRQGHAHRQRERAADRHETDREADLPLEDGDDDGVGPTALARRHRVRQWHVRHLRRPSRNLPSHTL
eukprot:2848815-Rhodomonas_salina.2